MNERKVKKEAGERSNGYNRDFYPSDDIIDSTNIKVCFLDFPQLINGCSRLDFSTLAINLLIEFDLIYAFSRFNGNGKDVPSSYRALSYCGIYPILVPFDPDPLISSEIVKFADKLGNKLLIGLLSGDKGFFNALLEGKRRGAKIKVILPPDNVSTLLTSVADYVARATDYAPDYNIQSTTFHQQCDKAKEEKTLIQNTTFTMGKIHHIRIGGI